MIVYNYNLFQFIIKMHSLIPLHFSFVKHFPCFLADLQIPTTRILNSRV